MQREIFLIRHAQSHQTTRLDHSQWPLSAQGASQAQVLARLLVPLEIEAIFSSPYQRCLDTVAPLASALGLTVHIREDLRERLLVSGWVDNLVPIWHRCWEDFDHAEIDCESSRVAQRRIVAEVTHIARSTSQRRVAVSSHGNAIGLLLNSLDPTFLRLETERIRNPDVIRLLVEDGELRWDRSYRLQGLEAISTDHSATPVTRD